MSDLASAHEFELVPIGVVHNDVAAPEEIPFNGTPTTLEILPDYAGEAARMKTGYIWVLTWLHHSERKICLASRSPYRANPVGITVARLLSIEEEGRRLRLDALDACDGTPLLDLKPYVRDFDAVLAPAESAWRREVPPELRLKRLVRSIERFCGSLTPPLALAARVALEVDQSLAPANSEELRWRCACALPVAAGIQATAATPLGDPRFTLAVDEGLVSAAMPDGQGLRLALKPTAMDADEILQSPTAALFRVSDLTA